MKKFNSENDLFYFVYYHKVNNSFNFPYLILQEAKRKAEEREMKKAEVRKRLEEAGKKKAKKGFLTPERKKKLRVSFMNATLYGSMSRK